MFSTLLRCLSCKYLPRASLIREYLSLISYSILQLHLQEAMGHMKALNKFEDQEIKNNKVPDPQLLM